MIAHLGGLASISSAILNQGYKVSASHAARGSIKTDAPTKVIWDIMRTWVGYFRLDQRTVQLMNIFLLLLLLLTDPNPPCGNQEH